jgi:hypothetical protein
LLRLQRNRVGSYSGLEFDIAIGVGMGTAVRIAGLMELGVGQKSGLCTEFDKSTGSVRAFDTGIGMLELLL